MASKREDIESLHAKVDQLQSVNKPLIMMRDDLILFIEKNKSGQCSEQSLNSASADGTIHCAEVDVPNEQQQIPQFISASPVLDDQPEQSAKML